MAVCKPGKLTIVNPSEEAEAAATNKWYSPTTMQILMDKYADSGVVGDTSIVGQDVNPYTGKAFTDEELKVAGVSDVAGYWGKYDAYGMLSNPDPGTLAAAGYGKDGCGGAGGVCGAGGAGGLPGAPLYETSPEAQAWMNRYGKYVSEGLEQGGYGMDAATMQKYQNNIYDTVKAQEQESIRTLRNQLEARGLTDSGYEFERVSYIRAEGTKTLARSINDLQIQNSLMKLSSFENLMGHSANLIGMLNQETYMKYQSKLYDWQAQVDIYKMALAQSYQQKNMKLAYQYDSMMQSQQMAWQKEMMEMEIQATQQAAKMQGWGNIVGKVLTFGLSLINPMLGMAAGAVTGIASNYSGGVGAGAGGYGYGGASW
jgi:hypothetical protein